MSFRSAVWVALSMMAVTACADDGAATRDAPLAQAIDGTVREPSPDAGATPPQTAVSGTKVEAECMSYSKAPEGMCAGYYCGVTEAEITASMPADSICPHPEFLCAGTIVGAVRACTRQVVIANLGLPLEPLRSEIATCVAETPELKGVLAEDCLGCYLDAAICAASNCLIECLSDAPGCDLCRAQNNCDAPVYTCGKTPSPF